ncbi:hypothetical protein ACH4CC_26535 [Streptomyces lydicus]|uniref:hypothetical protein n=1 Tax=Streptomyces lydicus TaxID=47763 RepID=UPI0037A6DC61
MITISDAEFEAAAGLSPAALVRYLSARRWSRTRRYGKGELWEVAIPGEREMREVLVPLDRGPRDYAARVADLVETLAMVEARRPADVLREMSLPSADWQFLRLTPPGPSGTAPLVDLVPALAGLRDLMTSAAAAAAAPTPQPVQPAQKPQRVKDHVASVRLDQTRVGSYVVAMHTPLPEAPAPEPRLELASRSEPFARKVTRCLYAALVCADQAATNSLGTDSLEDFAAYANVGLSANLCEALVKIGGDRAAGYSFDFSWSADLPVQPTKPIQLSHEQLGALDAGAKDLRARLGRRGMTLVGSVVRLHREAPNGPGEITVAGSFEDRDDGRFRRVRMKLEQQDYDRAAEAHRVGDEVVAKGDLTVLGSAPRMERIVEFVVQRPDD